MKNILLLLFILFSYSAFAQDESSEEKEKIEFVLHQFFKSLELKDSLLMKQTTMDEGQIWRRYNNNTPPKVDMRFSKDDLPSMHEMPDVKEIPLSMKIHINEGIAVAWIPYEFWIEGKLSHCGIDVFTLFEIEDEWKIVSTAYTVEKEKCK